VQTYGLPHRRIKSLAAPTPRIREVGIGPAENSDALGQKRSFAVSRPRGKSPRQSAFFTRSPKLREESSFLASVCSLLGVLPQAGTQVKLKGLANLTRGELLCQAFEVYQQLMPSHGISFEHAVFLVSALAQGEELALSNCCGCGALIVLDRAAFGAASCLHCGDQD
jgi:hypothetical protein